MNRRLLNTVIARGTLGRTDHTDVLAPAPHVRGCLSTTPATPRLNGKVERSHRIDAEEFCRMLEGIVIDDTEVFNDPPQEWQDFYDHNRPHGALGGQTPYERLRQMTTSPV